MSKARQKRLALFLGFPSCSPFFPVSRPNRPGRRGDDSFVSLCFSAETETKEPSLRFPAFRAFRELAQ